MPNLAFHLTPIWSLSVKWVSKLSKATRFIVGGAAVLFVISVILGMDFGSYNSPDYSDPVATFQFLGRNFKIDEASDADTKVHVVAGPYRYDYSVAADSVKRTILDANLLQSMKTPRRWRYLEQKHVEEWLGISTPAAVIAAFSKISKGTPSKKAKAAEYLVAGGVIAVGAMLCTGGVIGYFLTYSDEADYNNESFQRVLMDKNSWYPLAGKVRECRTKLIAGSDGCDTAYLADPTKMQPQP